MYELAFKLMLGRNSFLQLKINADVLICPFNSSCMIIILDIETFIYIYGPGKSPCKTPIIRYIQLPLHREASQPAW